MTMTPVLIMCATETILLIVGAIAAVRVENQASKKINEAGEEYLKRHR